MITAFELPAGLAAAAPPPTRGGVRLLVAGPARIEHVRFSDLGSFLSPGDLVVVNTSGTLAAAVDGIRRRDRQPVTVHFATGLDDGSWVVEVRPGHDASGPLPDSRGGDAITLPGDLSITLATPHPDGQFRLWQASIGVVDVPGYLARHGRPIRYGYVPEPVPLAEYQTVFAREPGSAEMPSAGRPFTTELVTELVSRGIAIAPITLHTGVSSQDAGEPPQPERYRVSEPTARAVNLTRAGGGRVVAVGTTATRALESAADRTGIVHPSSGWTELVLGTHRPARVVSGLITGWHAPGTSHLGLLEAVAGTELVELAYHEAVRARYLWHEFGDSCLLLP